MSMLRERLRALFLTCFSSGGRHDGEELQQQPRQGARRRFQVIAGEHGIELRCSVDDISLDAERDMLRLAVKQACSGGLTATSHEDVTPSGRSSSAESREAMDEACTAGTSSSCRATSPVPKLMDVRARARSLDQAGLHANRRGHGRRSADSCGQYSPEAGDAGAAGASAVALYRQLVHVAACRANYMRCPSCSNSPAGSLSPRYAQLLNPTLPRPMGPDNRSVSRRAPRVTAAKEGGCTCGLRSPSPLRYSPASVQSLRRVSNASGIENMSRLLQLTANGKPVMEALAERRSSSRLSSQGLSINLIAAVQAQLAMSLVSAQAHATPRSPLSRSPRQSPTVSHHLLEL